ncbi:MAG: Ig-like domain-containing protein [Oscillospiraceae bacterium]|nr:Ig-like domain-containing protein [Oscillospiraceae bacterium]
MTRSRHMIRSAWAVLITLLMTLIVLAFPHDASAWGINKTSITLVRGQAYTLKVTGVSSVPKWSSSNVNVASVNKNGKVTAKSAGTAVITAKVGSNKVSCTVNVKAGSLKASSSSLSVKAGSSKIIYITAKGSHAVKVTSSDKRVATASWADSSFTDNKIGLRIRGVSNGDATIKVYMSRYTNIYTKINVSVYGGSSSAYTDLSTTVNSVSVNAGSSSTFTVTSGSGSNTRISIANSNIATVEKSQWVGNRVNVRVTGKSAGNTYVYITNNNTGTTKSIPVYVTGSTLSLSKTSGSISVGGTDTISVNTSYPRYVSVYSSNQNVATAQVTHYYNTSCNVTVTGRQAGNATISITDDYTGASRTYKVTVTGASLRTSTSNVSVKVNGSTDFTVYSNYANYLNIVSSNSNVAQAAVSRYGNGSATVTVYGYRQGNCTITIQDTYTGANAKVNVSVSGGRNLSASVSSLSMNRDQSKQFTLYCSDPNYIDVSSNNTGVATVYTSDWGNDRCTVNVYAAGSGSANIRIYDRMSGSSINIPVTVGGGNALSVSPSSLNLESNGPTGTFTVYGDDLAYVNAYSSDYNVANVYERSNNGNSKTFTVDPGQSGRATITVTNSYTGRSVNVSVNVEGGQIEMQVGASSLNLSVGQNESFTVRCSSASNMDVSVGNYSVCSVNASVTGTQSAVIYVTAVGPGSTVITLRDPVTGQAKNVSVNVSGGNNGGGGVYYDEYDPYYYI